MLTPAQAADHVGETATVEGVVSDIGHSARSQTTFLNFGGKYPNHAFTAVIFREAQSQFPDADKWLGKKLRLSGRIQLYRGKPEVVLSRAPQVQLEE